MNKSSILNLMLLLALFLLSCTKQKQLINPETIEDLSTSFLNTLKDETGTFRVSPDSEYIILLPDIQNYISNPSNNKYLEEIIAWILKFNNAGFKTKAVLQVGDLTNFNSDIEYQRVKRIFSPLDGNIDYIFCTGNHDYGDNGSANNRHSLFSNYFKYEDNNSLISSLEDGKYDNALFEIYIQGRPLQIFSLEFGPGDKVLNWVNDIQKQNPDKLSLILTHTYLSVNKERFNYAKYKHLQGSPGPYAFGLSKIYKVNDGEEIWNKLVYPSKNIKFVFCGHCLMPGNDYNIISMNSFNDSVLQMVFNKQDSPNGGDGWIRILEFTKDSQLFSKSYSVRLNQWQLNDFSQTPFNY